MSKFKNMLPSRLIKKYNVGCKISGKHVHLYKKVVDGYTLSRYIHGEKLEVDGYKLTDDFMRSDSFYDGILKLINKHHLFRGESNLDYLYGLAAKNKETYLEYEYEYMEEDIKFEVDEQGNTIPLVGTFAKKGWHENIADPNNTGNVRVCRPMYYGYKVVMQKDKPKLVKSPLVSNIKDIIVEYPYFCENCYEITTELLPQYKEKEAQKKM